jgi:hypothetical protein
MERLYTIADMIQTLGLGVCLGALLVLVLFNHAMRRR